MSISINGTTGISGVIGTASTPALIGDDADTGLFFPAANVIALSTGGVERLRIDSSGKVGINKTPSPGGGGFGQGLQIKQTDAVYSGLQIEKADDDSILGIGYWNTSGTFAFHATYQSTGSYLPISFHTSGTERLRITSTGLMGLGTSSPSRKLDVVVADNTTYAGNTDNANSLNLFNTSTTNETFSSIRLGSQGSASAGIVTLYGVQTANAAGSGYFAISTRNAGTFAERFRITSEGNVAIGSTNPQRKLVVSEGGAQGFEFFPGDGGGGNTLNHYNRSTSAFINATTNADQHIWGRADGEKARIDSSGRLLIGTSSARTTQHSIGGNNVYDVVAHMQHERTGEAGGFSVVVNKDDASGSFLNLAKARGSSVGSNTIVASGDVLGTIGFFGADGTDITSWGGAIQCFVDGTPGANDMPGRLVFSTTADGAASPTERMRITNSGYLKASNSGSYYAVTNPYHEFIGAGVNDLVTHFENTTATGPYGIRIRFSGASPNNSTNYFLQCIDSGTTIRTEIRSNGGLANFQANNVNLSDINTKKDITPASGTWNCLKEWEIVNYRYKDQPDDADLNLGVIAQQVAESCPEVITVFQEATENEPEKLGVKEQQMYWMAIKALQEAQERIETLEAQNSDFAARLAALESA